MPQLNLFTGNRLTTLAEMLAKRISAGQLKSPFEAEIVIVQSKGMERWLSLELAKRHGICANFRFPFPNTFIYQMLNRCLPELPEATNFDPDVLTFAIVRALPGLLKNTAFNSLDRYLSGDQRNLKLYQLSRKIAGVFDQYTIFRPDMILGWELGAHDDIGRPADEAWQAILWRSVRGMASAANRNKLADGNPVPNRARLIYDFLKALHENPLLLAKLPSRISMFGAPSLPPFYMNIFQHFAQFIEVNLFVLNPCREFWDDIASDKEADRAMRRFKSQESDPSALYFERGNSLLASWGTLGRDFLNQIHSFEFSGTDDFSDPEPNCLLACIQSDILNLKERGGAKTVIDPTDRSLQVHSCHGPIREIETLYDNLLAMFEVDAQLQPQDILVITPDIENYAPFIQAVFDAPESEARRIPYSIADRHVGRENPIVAALSALLDLPDSRYEISRMVRLLEMPVIQQRFDLPAPEIDLIAAWLNDTRIKWGINATHRRELGLPGFQENSWRAGLDRLLLGYALPGGDEKLYQGILPYDHIEGDGALTLGKFARLAGELFSLNTELREPRSLAAWSATLLRLCERFVLVPGELESDYQVVRNALSRLTVLQELSGCGDIISLDVIKDHLQGALEQASSGQGFIAGGVTFGSMLPMRSIPFKVICLIGLNHDTYPRRERHLSFDLMAKNPRRGDRSAKNSDRYLFLEAIISAGCLLYISYNGQNVEDNSFKPPSVLVSELLDYIERAFEIPDIDIIEHVVTKHRLQAFSPAYFQGDGRLFSYSDDNCRAALAALGARHEQVPLITTGLPEMSDEFRQLSLDDLSKFFSNPAKFLLNSRLGIVFEEADQQFDDRDSFSLTGLDRYLLMQELLERDIAGANIEQFLPVAKALGVLPYGPVGDFAYDNVARQVKKFADNLRLLISPPPLEPLIIDIEIAGIQLTGKIDNIYRDALYQFRPAQLKAKDYLRAWITHLALGLTSRPLYPSKSVLIGSDRRVEFRMVEECGGILRDLIEIYQQGLTRPLPFFPNTSWAYAKAISNGKTESTPIYLAERIWEDHARGRGEREDTYFQACWGDSSPLNDEFRELAVEIYGPMLKEIKNDNERA